MVAIYEKLCLTCNMGMDRSLLEAVIVYPNMDTQMLFDVIKHKSLLQEQIELLLGRKFQYWEHVLNRMTGDRGIDILCSVLRHQRQEDIERFSNQGLTRVLCERGLTDDEKIQFLNKLPVPTLLGELKNRPNSFLRFVNGLNSTQLENLPLWDDEGIDEFWMQGKNETLHASVLYQLWKNRMVSKETKDRNIMITARKM